MKLGELLYVTNREDWRRWLARHHKTKPEVWLLYFKVDSARPRIPYNDAVEEALCFGWIDSIVKRIDEDRFAQRFSPRRPTSRLSETNKERIRRLIARRLMTRAGLQAIAHVYDYGKDRAQRPVIPPDILHALKADRDTWSNFRKFPSAYQRVRVAWIDDARVRPSEFAKRLRYFLRMTKAGKRFGMVQ